MTTSKGPWVYDAESGYLLTKDKAGDVSPYGPTIVCDVYVLDGISNGYLLAAAPDLLEFAKAYADQFRGYQITNTKDAKHDATGWLMDMARAALAKAEQ